MQLPEYITNSLDEIAQKEGFDNCKYEIESASKHGENFIGDMTAVKLIGGRVQCGEIVTDTLNLLCKIVSQSKLRRDTFRAIPAFKREIFMYTRVLPTFVEFQREKGLAADESFLSFPKVFATIVDETNDRYALIMEDLRPKQFVMWPRHEPISLQHEILLMTQLGKFHGISYALKDQRPDIFAEFEALEDIYADMIANGHAKNLLGYCIERAIDVLADDGHKNALEKLKRNYFDIYKSFFTKESIGKYGVINHGDAWTNNFLFQYADDTKELKDVCFIDWQLSRYGSSVLDLHFHLFSSTTKQLRDQSYQDLLKVYHTALCDIVRKLGSDPETIFPFSDLMNELRACGKYALIMGVMLVPFVNSEDGDVVDMEDYSERFANGEIVPLFKKNSGTVYTKVVNDVVGDIISYGYDH